MQPTVRSDRVEASDYREHVEAHVLRLYAAIVLLLWVMGGLVWGLVTALQAAPRRVDDSVLALLALCGVALAGAVLLLLAQLAQWVRRRVKW